ncbi:MAG: MerR family transcriptional regulator [Bauldia sp.]|nr:MerR family transcriptional regulator [Bauldia sp.]
MDTRNYTIGEIARRCGLSTRTVRFYADAGLLSPGRSAAGYRLFDDRDVVALDLVRVLREAGAGLDAIGAVLSGAAGLAEVLALRLAEVEAHIRDQKRVAATLRAALKSRRAYHRRHQESERDDPPVPVRAPGNRGRLLRRGDRRARLRPAMEGDHDRPRRARSARGGLPRADRRLARAERPLRRPEATADAARPGGGHRADAGLPPRPRRPRRLFRPLRCDQRAHQGGDEGRRHARLAQGRGAGRRVHRLPGLEPRAPRQRGVPRRHPRHLGPRRDDPEVLGAGRHPQRPAGVGQRRISLDRRGDRPPARGPVTAARVTSGDPGRETCGRV